MEIEIEVTAEISTIHLNTMISYSYFIEHIILVIICQYASLLVMNMLVASWIANLEWETKGKLKKWHMQSHKNHCASIF